MEVKKPDPHSEQESSGTGLPLGWALTRVDEAGEVLGGRQRSPAATGEQTDYLRVANVFDGYIDTSDILSMPFTREERARFALKPGDILLNEGQSLELVGRSAIYRGEPVECCFQNTLVRFRSYPHTDPRYAQYLFQQYLRQGTFSAIALQTTSIAHLGAGRFAKLQFVTPPPEEQRAIGEALEDADALIDSLERLLVKKRQVKLGAMEDLLTGKRRLTKSQDWHTLRLGDCAILKARIGWQGLTTSEYRQSGEYILVTGTEIAGGRVDWDSCHYVDRARYEQDRNIQLVAGDVLVTKDGTIGKVALVDELSLPATLNSGIFVIRPLNQSFHSGFFFYLLASTVFSKFLAQLSAGSTISHLYQKDFVNFTFLAPEDPNEQKLIYEALAAMDSDIAALEVRLAKVRVLKQAMMQVLLTGRIRLVPAKPNVTSSTRRKRKTA